MQFSCSYTTVCTRTQTAVDLCDVGWLRKESGPGLALATKQSFLERVNMNDEDESIESEWLLVLSLAPNFQLN